MGGSDPRQNAEPLKFLHDLPLNAGFSIQQDYVRVAELVKVNFFKDGQRMAGQHCRVDLRGRGGDQLQLGGGIRGGQRIIAQIQSPLPQLFNVLCNDMSLVGPRPLIESEIQTYYADMFDTLLSVKPGVTGYWQAYARNNATYQSGQRQQMELYYIHNASAWLDIKILSKTVISVLKREGAK